MLKRCFTRQWFNYYSRSTSSSIHLLLHRSQSSRILQVYQARVKNGELKEDTRQIETIKHLDRLDQNLRNYTPSLSNELKPISLLSDFFSTKNGASSSSSNNKSQVQGLYLHGDVGCGKTMLMDLFFDNCCVNPSCRRRVHFHAFMLEFHNRLHLYKMEHKAQGDSRIASTGESRAKFNPIPAIADEIMSESWLLCLDEFQVTDIGDAMILRYIFKELFNRGMIMIATSNRHPDDLYKNGLQRSNFLPFIPMLKRNCSVVKLQTGIDYRRLVGQLAASSQDGTSSTPSHIQVFYSDGDSGEKLDLIFKVLANSENDTVRPKTLNIKGRNVTFSKTCGGVLDSTFTELCDKPLGALDYLTISQAFHTVFVRYIPQLDMRTRVQARRFITMIDTFYDNGVRVLFSAHVPPDQLFSVEAAAPDGSAPSDDNRKLMDDLGVKSADASIFSGEEEVFAFYRTLSRIAEMQTAQYWNSRKEQDE